MGSNRKYTDFERFIIKTFKACHDPICYYCGKNLLKLPRDQRTVDHKRPLDQGGETTYTNLVWSCLECNNEKAWRNEEEYKEYLLTKQQKQIKEVISTKVVKPVKVIEPVAIVEPEPIVNEIIDISEPIVSVTEEIHKIPIVTNSIEINNNVSNTQKENILKDQKRKEKRKQKMKLNEKRNKKKVYKKIDKTIHDSSYYNLKKFNKKHSSNKMVKLFEKIENKR